MSQLSTPEDIEGMRRAAQIVVRTLDYISAYVHPGISTGKLNDLCHAYITKEEGAESASLGYKGYPKSICTSINSVVCHGIPNNQTKLRAGDIVNIDVAIKKDGYFGDSSRMFCVGKVNPFAKRLVEVTRLALYRAIKQVKAGNHLGDIGHAIQSYVEAENFSVVTEYCGHGIGKKFHSDPQVLHYGEAGQGAKLSEGMCFTIEPMINGGVPATKVLGDEWTVVTADGKPSAQWEHTVFINSAGECEVLTLAEEETIQ